MSKKRAAGTINLNVTTDEAAEEPGDEAKQLGPLFSLQPEGGLQHIKTRVYRQQPIDEGHVGDLMPDATEQDIRTRWGGGTFSCQAIDQEGHIIKGGRQTLRLSGEPRFDNAIGRKRYQKWLHEEFQEEEPAAAAAPPTLERPMSAMDMLLFVQKQSEVARAEAREQADQRRRDDDASHQRRLEELREEGRRRQAEAEERERARAKEAEERAERDRQFLATQHAMTLQLVQAMNAHHPDDGGAVKTLIAGMEIAGKMMGGGNDPLAAAIENIPEILRATVETVGAVRAEGGGAGARPARSRGSAKVAGENQITLDGAIGAKYRQVISELQAAGHDPEQVLTQAADAILRAKVRKAETKGGGDEKKTEEEKPRKPAPRRA